MGEADPVRPCQILLAGMAVGDPETSGRCGPSTCSATALARRGAISCSTARSETNTRCQCVTPSRRVVVSSEAIAVASRSALAILPRAASSGSDRRRNALAMAPSAILSPKSSPMLRPSRSKPTWWL